MSTTQPSVAPARAAATRETTYPLPWWTLIVTGSLWMLFAIVVFPFDITSVTVVGIAVAVVCIAAGSKRVRRHRHGGEQCVEGGARDPRRGSWWSA
jgi:hypothetical protein